MKYRGLISIDWGKPHRPNEQEAVIAALVQAGWLLAETTALTIECDDVSAVWHGVEIVARGSTVAGTITAFTFNFVGSDDFARSRQYAAAKNHPNALEKIQGLEFPKSLPPAK